MQSGTYAFKQQSARAKPSTSNQEPELTNPFAAWGAHVAGETDLTAEESLDAILRRTEAHSAAIKESEQRTLRLALEARDVGANTLKTLHGQHEQISRVTAAQAQVEQNLNASDRLLKGMETWRGAIAQSIGGWFGGKQPSSRQEMPAAEQKGPKGASSDSGGGGARQEQGSKWPPADSTFAAANAEKQDDAVVGEISSIVSDLRAQADAMNTELRSQSVALDHLGENFDRTDGRLKSSNQRTRKLL
mmetsp:Transcript_12317/g.23851  ORF Transcript_12317/g.23851 Transcript_12317/m.23851 type:complete len:247 (+) Transcript_12317:130-870(+)